MLEADANDDINGSGPATDYLDFDLVDLKEDLDDIATILKLSDIAKDKASFTVSCTTYVVVVVSLVNSFRYAHH